VLEKEGTALDAVTAAVVSMEDHPLFNAGKGAVYNSGRFHELEAHIADGITRKIGVVTGLQSTKNPIVAAHTVLKHSRHNMLGFKAADEFAAKHGCEQVDNSWFNTEDRLKALIKAQEQLHNEPILDHTGQTLIEKDKKYQHTHDDDHQSVMRNGAATGTNDGADDYEDASIAHEKQHVNDNEKNNEFDGLGTVGAVAVDIHGNVAAATSTGGMTNKWVGRIGDTPIHGCGGYADNDTAAISTTGNGEFIMRSILAYDCSCLMDLGGLEVQEASHRAIKRLARLGKGSEAGLIAVTRDGNVGVALNSHGMYRGIVREDGVKKTAVWHESWE
jgi:beta-aspartyl-peptidase (threonine type)